VGEPHGTTPAPSIVKLAEIDQWFDSCARLRIDRYDVYKSAFDLSDMSDAMDDQTAGSMVPRCVADLKPGVCDAPLHGFGA